MTRKRYLEIGIDCAHLVPGHVVSSHRSDPLASQPEGCIYTQYRRHSSSILPCPAHDGDGACKRSLVRGQEKQGHRSSVVAQDRKYGHWVSHSLCQKYLPSLESWTSLFIKGLHTLSEIFCRAQETKHRAFHHDANTRSKRDTEIAHV